MKKSIVFLVLALLLVLPSCAAVETPTFPNAENLASCLYRDVGVDMTRVYAEPLLDDSAYVFGMNADYFHDTVADAVCFRMMIDTDGQTLYVMKMKNKKDAFRFASMAYENYEFPPCDPADKMAVASENEYVMVFKANAGEVNKTVETFIRMMGGHLRFEREKVNKG